MSPFVHVWPSLAEELLLMSGHHSGHHLEDVL